MISNRSRLARLASFACIAGTLLVGMLGQSKTHIAAAQTPDANLDPAFRQLWDCTDLPVSVHRADRAWIWGPQAIAAKEEPYAEGAAGQHMVEYFDKGRMEIAGPTRQGEPLAGVSSGLLVVEMISGRVRTGRDRSVQKVPSTAPLAGDDLAPSQALTYASLARVASLTGDNPATDRTGQMVLESLDAVGRVTPAPSAPREVKYAHFEPTLKHNMPGIFWDYLHSKGLIYSGGIYSNDTLLTGACGGNWIDTVGLPITEPYWITISRNGTKRHVLMQAYQRRILIYWQEKPAGYEVEAANTGRDYFNWRYGPVANPEQGAISANPILVIAVTLLLAGGAVTAALLPRSGEASDIVDPTRSNNAV
ncbi:MAG: hypothetical protein M3014_09615 [Chloroflexota bacterium]|nr:hypothetical protein [Chloroflexota bacterium]